MYFKEPLILSSDIDGVLIYNFQLWKHYFNAKMEEHNHSIYIKVEEQPTWNYLRDICKKCWDYVLHNHNIVMAYELRPDAKEVLSWFKSLGAEIHLVTSRPKDVAEATGKWAEEVLPGLISSVVVTNNKVVATTELNARFHLEDAPHHLRAFETQTQVTPIIFDTVYNQTSEGYRVHNWKEFASFVLAKTS